MSKSFFRTFLEDSGVYLIPTLLSQGVGLFLVPLYTRILSPADYGVIDMIKTFSSIACLVVALEISQAYGRFYVEEETISGKKTVSSTALIFTIVTFLIFLLICQIFTPTLSKVLFGQSGLDFYFRIGTIYISMKGVTLLLQTQFRYEMKRMDYVYNAILLFSITSFFSLFLAYFNNWGLRGMVLALLIGQFASMSFGIWKQRLSNNLKISKIKLKEMLRFSAPLVPSGIAIFLAAYISRIMINYYLSLTEVGLYGIGFRFASIVILLIAGVNRSLSPLIYNHYKEKDTPRQIAKTFRLFIVFSLVFFYGITAFAPELLRLLTTPDYYASHSIIIYLVPALLLSQMYIFGPGLGIAKKTKIIMLISIGNAILTISLNWIFIRLYGYEGAAIATLISFFCVFIVKMYMSQKYYYIPFKWLNIIIASIIVTFITVLATLINIGLMKTLIIKIIIGGALFIVFYVTRLIKREEFINLFVLSKKYFQ